MQPLTQRFGRNPAYVGCVRVTQPGNGDEQQHFARSRRQRGERPLDAALLHLARAASLAALRDVDGRRRAIADADAAAAKITAAELIAQFAAERAKVAAIAAR
jgi:hypothetical protein